MSRAWLQKIKDGYPSSVDQDHGPGAVKREPSDFLGWMERDLRHGRDELDFWIYHYAGKVHYSVEDAVARNMDRLTSDVAAVLAGSDMELLAAFGREAAGGGGGGGGGGAGARHTVAASFRHQLIALEEDLASTDPHFVRCIKPNCTMRKGGRIENHRVLEQLLAAGMHAVIAMRRAGYPVRRSFDDFVGEFGAMVGDWTQLRAVGRCVGGLVFFFSLETRDESPG